MPDPTPADWHDSLESLEETINNFGREGWTFPDPVLEEEFDTKTGPRRYRLHAGTRENPGLIAVRPTESQ
jgi:hypothetical protein